MKTPRTKPATGLLARGTVPKNLVDLVLASVSSPNTRRSYAKGIAALVEFAAGRPINLMLLMEWRTAMAGNHSTATVNSRITAVRRLVKEARRTGALSLEEAFDLLEIQGMPFRGNRLGNWLTLPQFKRLLSVPNRKSDRGRRNYCVLALLGGCALRVGELADLEVDGIRQREGRWVIADLYGKGGRVRTVAVDLWVKEAIDGWARHSKITEGRIVRQLTLKPEGLSVHGIRHIVQKAAEKIGVQGFGPHDLRRTCARLCWEKGGSIEQIQAMLGHASPVTTARYIGAMQNLKNAVNDGLLA